MFLGQPGHYNRISSTLTPPPPPPPPGPGNPPPAGPPAVNIADPQITKRGDLSLALPGETVIFTLTVTNPGSLAAPGVTVTDPLPDPLIAINASQTQGTHTISNNTVTFTIGTVNPGQVVTLTVITRVSGSAVPPMDVTNSASLTWSGGSPRSGSAALHITRGTLPSTGEHPDATPLPVGWIVLGFGAIIAAFVHRSRQRGRL